MCDDSCIFLVTTQSTGGIDPASLSPAPPRSATHAAMPQIGPTPVPASRRRRSRALRRRSTGRRRARGRGQLGFRPAAAGRPTTPSPVQDDDDIAIGSTEPLLCLELRGTSTTASHCCVEEEGEAPPPPDHHQARKEEEHRLDLDTAQTPRTTTSPRGTTRHHLATAANLPASTRPPQPDLVGRRCPSS